MKIVIPGGNGQVGRVLARAFVADGHDVVVLSRRPIDAPWRIVAWDGETLSDWTREIDGADVVINLAGRSVNCRYGSRNRRDIIDSRVRSTRVLGEAIANADRPPRVWLQASTATIYAHRFDAANDEATGILGGEEPNAPDTWRFSIDVAKAWEQAANDAVVPQTRKVLMRSAMTIVPTVAECSTSCSASCATASAAKQAMVDNICPGFTTAILCAVYWLIDREEFTGPVNLDSPNPIPNAEFMSALREAWGIRFGLPATRWMLEIGTFFLRTESELILKSRRVVPSRLLQSGFQFNFPNWREAAEDLCQRWRARREMHLTTDER